MVPGMIVGVADQNVDDDPPEQLGARLGRVQEPKPHQFGQLRVGRVPGRELVELEQSQGAQDVAAQSRPGAVEAVNEQGVTTRRGDQFGRNGVDSTASGQLHAHRLGLHPREHIGRHGELRDQLPAFAAEHSLGSSASGSGTERQGIIEVVGERQAPGEAVAGLDELLEGAVGIACFVAVRVPLHVERTDPVRPGLEQVGE